MKTAIKAGQLIDGTGAAPLRGAIVIVDGERIAAIERADAFHPSDAVHTVDASDRTVMPGLIDAHVHITFSSVSLEQRLFTRRAVAYFKAALNLKRTLTAGFTTVRDAGGADAGLREALELGLISGPRLVVSGGIGQTGGLMESRFPSGALIQNEDSWRVCDGVEEVRKTMRKVLREDVDFVKISTSGGVIAPQGSPFIPEWSPDELEVIVEEARRHGAGVMAHAEGNAGIKNALRAGVTSVEHGDVLDQEAIDLFLESGTILVPTFHILRVLSERGDAAGMSSAAQKKKDRLVRESRGSFRLACEAGVKIALGTDAVLAEMHGTNARELSLMMEEGGLTPMDVIVAGTRNAAECCLLGDQVGTLEPGKYADLLIVDGDPLADIAILQDATRITVYKEGKLIE